MGGGDPVGNMRLKLALQKARENNVPKDNIQRAIAKGVGATDMDNYEEITYEGYGPGGVALTVECLTDNRIVRQPMCVMRSPRTAATSVKPVA